MDRQELLFRGAVTIGTDTEPTPGVELWASGRTMMAFAPQTPTPYRSLLTLHNIALNLVDGLLVVTGDEGEARAAQTAQPLNAWVGVTVTFPNGDEWTAVTIESSTVGVKITRPDGERLMLLGAVSDVLAGRKFITLFADGGEIAVSNPPSTCGPCSGSR